MRTHKDPTPQQIREACALFFTDEPGDGACPGERVDIRELKKAFRAMIFRNHPDRSRILGVDNSVLSERSKKITESYRTLLDALERKKPIIMMKARPSSGARAGIRPTIDERFFGKIKKFDIPGVKMKLGQFVYYLGIIDFKTLLRAIQWQKDHRRYFGEIARDLGFLADDDVTRVFREKRKGERFGACAERLSLLKREQTDYVILMQRRRLPRIGEFFISKKILTPEELDLVTVQLSRHNRKASSEKTA